MDAMLYYGGTEINSTARKCLMRLNVTQRTAEPVVCDVGPR